MHRKHPHLKNFRFSLTIPYLKVSSVSPSPISTLPSLSSVPKYEMPESKYATLSDTVLAYKKDHKIGRFDPAAPEIQEQKVREMWKEVEERSKSDADPLIAFVHILLNPEKLHRPLVSAKQLRPLFPLGFPVRTRARCT